MSDQFNLTRIFIWNSKNELNTMQNRKNPTKPLKTHLLLLLLLLFHEIASQRFFLVELKTFFCEEWQWRA